MEKGQVVKQGSGIDPTGFGVVAVLFGLLLLAYQGTEVLQQAVIAPGTAAELGIAADCRPDELEEEALSLEECQLMVSNVQIMLASSPAWYRSFKLLLATASGLAAVLSVAIGMGMVVEKRGLVSLAIPVFGLLLVLDGAGFIAALNTGPLLRAQTLWPALLWFFIHLSLVTGALVQHQQQAQDG